MWNSVKFYARGVWVVTKETFVNSFYRDNCGLLAAGISFYALLSLIPVIFLLAAAFGYFLSSSDDAFYRVHEYIVSHLPVSAVKSFDVLSKTAQERRVFGIVGLLGFMWAAQRIFASLADAMNIVWKAQKGRSYAVSKLLALVSILTMILFLIASIGITTAYRLAAHESLPLVGTSFANKLPFFSDLLYLALSELISALLFFLVYRILPNKKVALIPAVVAALFGSIMWQLSIYAFDLYISNAANLTVVYGSFGGFVVLMLWIYYSMYVLLIGGELGSSVERYMASLTRPLPTDFAT